MTVQRNVFERSSFVRLAVQQRPRPGETIAACVAAGRRLGLVGMWQVSKIFKASQQLRRYADANWQGVGSNMEPGRMY